MQIFDRPSTELFSEVVTVAARYKDKRDRSNEFKRCDYLKEAEEIFPHQEKADLALAFRRLIHCDYQASKSCLHLFKWLRIEEVISEEDLDCDAITRKE